MKIYKIVFTLFVAISCGSVLADNNLEASSQSVYIDNVGVVDAIYLDESRLVVSDVSLIYNHASTFYNAQGLKVRSLNRVFKIGTAVKYHYYQKSSKLILKDIRVISMRELNKAIENTGELY